ncbi:MAG: DSD1 family PLP-dependent enzyme [Candidatus Latescibacteria bacterium]|nr:DSD1 family PLP-dependent enzyme [Candidatus Latescibacterota bacterium]
MSLIGLPKHEIDTPALLVDLSALERNIERMARIIVREAGVRWRPHTKGIKTPAIAHMLLRAGASGVTCAKLGEAEVMAAAGVRDILIANQIVGAQKIARLVNLRQRADVVVAVDGVENIEALDRAAREKGVRLRVVIEVNVGMNRAGVEPGAPTLALAKRVAALPGLQFAGVMTWESSALRIKEEEEKRRVVLEALQRLTATAQMCRDAGLPVEIVSCGGTGTYWMSAFQPGITEIQAGGGVLCDLNYIRNFHVPDHEYALTVLSIVTSRPTPTRIIFDAGRKAMSAEAGPPEPVGIANVKSVGLSAEHGKIELEAPGASPRVGDKIELIVGYGDVTVALYDVLYGVRDGKVEAVWPILGRGKLQ